MHIQRNKQTKMKVDKAVCTDTMTDTENAISYENLLSTLVQNKILAIKRECEAKKVEKQKRKQQNCLGSLIFGKRPGRSDKCEDDNERPTEEMAATEMHSSHPSISQPATVTESKDETLRGDDSQSATVTSTVHANKQEPSQPNVPTDVVINCVQANDLNAIDEQIDETESCECQNVALNECSSGDNDNNSIQTLDEFRTDIMKYSRNVKNSPRNGENNKSDPTKLRINLTEHVQCMPTNSDNSSTIERDIESPIAIAMHCKSPSIVSRIEVSDEINAKQKFRTRKSSSDTFSVPSLMKRTTSTATDDAIAVHDQEQRHQIRLLEAKSISAQCSPIFAQRATFNGESIAFLYFPFLDIIFHVNSSAFFRFSFLRFKFSSLAVSCHCS